MGLVRMAIDFRPTTLFTLGVVLVAATPLPGQQAPRRQIGVEIGSPDYTFHRIADIAVSSEGEVFVLDSGDRQVKAYDRRGRFLRAFGRAGGGPGEFSRPLELALDSILRVFDADQRRVSRFSQAGEHLSTTRMVAPSGVHPVNSVEMRSGHWVAITLARYSLGAERHDPNYHVLVFRPDSPAVDTLITMRSGGTAWRARGEALPWGLAPSDFGRAGAWAVAGDSVVVVIDGYTGDARWYAFDERGRRLAKTGTLPIESRPITDEDLDDVERATRAKYDGVPSRLDLYPPPAWSGATRAEFDDQGRLWITIPTMHGNVTKWLVLTPRGDRLWACLERSFQLEAISGGEIYGVGRTANDVQVVQVFGVDQLEWSGVENECRVR